MTFVSAYGLLYRLSYEGVQCRYRLLLDFVAVVRCEAGFGLDMANPDDIFREAHDLDETITQPQQMERTRRRQRAVTRWKWVASTGIVWGAALFSLLLMPVLAGVALLLCANAVWARHDGLLLVSGVLVIGGLFVVCFRVNRSILAETRSFLPAHPDTYRNAHLLPAEETLMRASEIPLELQQQLLRSLAREDASSDELLQAYPTEKREQRVYVLRPNRQEWPRYDRPEGLTENLSVSNASVLSTISGKALHHEPDQRRGSSGGPAQSERPSGE